MERPRLHGLRVRVGLALAAAVCATFAGGGGAFAQSTRPATSARGAFVAAVERNFATWDRDQDGELESAEVDVAIKDHALRGDDAAAAASLKLTLRSRADELPKLTRAYFAAYAKSGAAPATRESGDAAADATTDPGTQDDRSRDPKGVVLWDRLFAASKTRIARNLKDGTSLWRPDEISIDNARQGALGDCFFVATVGSMAVRSPGRLRQMVEPLPGGGYRVTFPEQPPVEIDPLTEAQLALGGTTEGDGAWLRIMEEAFGRLRARTRTQPFPDVVDGTDILRKGGDSAVTIRALTGNKTRRITFPVSVEERAAKRESQLPDVRKLLIENLREGRLITAGTLPRKLPEKDGQPVGTASPRPPGVVFNHVYTVVTYDEKTDTVELWNPHGNTFQPKGPAGIGNGYPTQHGRFRLPLAEAYAFMTSFTFEVGE